MTEKQPFVYYRTELKERAREMRKKETRAEKILWDALRKRNILGYKFTRQKPILGYIADFYCAELFLIIEVDGSVHEIREACDEARTKEMEAYGFHVKRYRNEDIENRLPFVLEDLMSYIKIKEISQH